MQVSFGEADVTIVGKVSDRRTLHQKALDLLKNRVKPKLVLSSILKQAPHLSWKAPAV